MAAFFELLALCQLIREIPTIGAWRSSNPVPSRLSPRFPRQCSSSVVPALSSALRFHAICRRRSTSSDHSRSRSSVLVTITMCGTSIYTHLQRCRSSLTSDVDVRLLANIWPPNEPKAPAWKTPTANAHLVSHTFAHACCYMRPGRVSYQSAVGRAIHYAALPVTSGYGEEEEVGLEIPWPTGFIK